MRHQQASELQRDLGRSETSARAAIHISRTVLIAAFLAAAGFLLPAGTARGQDSATLDSDGDGLTDLLELDLGMSYGCPSPYQADSDGDSLSDSDEVLRLFTDPCNADTDGDGLLDNVDPLPRHSGDSQTYIESQARFLADYLLMFLDPSMIVAPNLTVALARRSMLASLIQDAANATSDGYFSQAISQLQAVLQRVDGVTDPPDWISDLAEAEQIADELEHLIALLTQLMPEPTSSTEATSSSVSAPSAR